jgi:hypothetical protein
VVEVVAVESRRSQWSRVKIWTADLEACGGLFRGGFVNLLWVLSGVWLAVACGGLFRGGSGWFLFHRWCWVVGFGSLMGWDGLPGGLWWFFGWVAVVMVDRRCWGWIWGVGHGGGVNCGVGHGGRRGFWGGGFFGV